MPAPRISIVIPVLNEAALIRGFLQHLREWAAPAEVIVVDGGSADKTAEIAETLCSQVVRAPRGRAAQMNSGAGAASGEILWFLHVDAEIPHGALTAIETALQDRHVVGGFFRIRLPRTSWIYRLTDSFAHYAGLLMRMRCGDHGLFCRRDVFKQIGGYPNVSLMEDVDFFRELRRRGRVVVVPDRILVNPRRYEEIGPFRLTFVFGLIGILYFVHAPRSLCEWIYRRAC